DWNEKNRASRMIQLLLLFLLVHAYISGGEKFGGQNIMVHGQTLGHDCLIWKQWCHPYAMASDRPIVTATRVIIIPVTTSYSVNKTYLLQSCNQPTAQPCR
ncbi:hypothetical protein V1508DRAFT_425943, partial [Lipomyces doorenjongii]|uniref:uncharacterized protein n=1 Tax=Lipomyces doorenjongii TaxID=383834 RepID=UPI0034CFDEE2